MHRALQDTTHPRTAVFICTGQDLPVLSQEVLRRAGAASPPRTLVDVLLDTAARHPTAPALDDGTTVLTYAELVADVEQRACALAGRGGATR